jgi:hypothetical protein
VPTALRREEYGGEEDDEYGSWVLLESTAGGEAEGDAPAEVVVPEAVGSGDSRSESCLLVTEGSTVDSIPFRCLLRDFIGFGSVRNWFFQAEEERDEFGTWLTGDAG